MGKLLSFEIRKQVTSLTFILVILIFTGFVITQFTELLYLPVASQSDIYALDQAGERDFIFIAATDEEIKVNTLNLLQSRIEDGSIPSDAVPRFDTIIAMLQDSQYNFDDVFEYAQSEEYIFPWITAARTQFYQKFGGVEEVNEQLKSTVGKAGYTKIFYQKYVTYMQVIAALLIFPIFLLLFTKDYRQNVYEIVYAQPLSSTKYILCRYFSALIPLLIYLYLFGILLNAFSALQFTSAGWEYKYTPFIVDYLIYILPTVTFLSSLMMLLMMLINKAIAVFPIYIIYAIFNITPDVFENAGLLGILFKPVIRLDRQEITIQEVFANRILYLILALIFIIVSCQLYKRVRCNLRKAVTV